MSTIGLRWPFEFWHWTLDIAHVLATHAMLLGGVFLGGVFVYGLWWFATCEGFRQAFYPVENAGASPIGTGRALPALLKERFGPFGATTPDQLRAFIAERAPNLINAAKRIPVGHPDEFADLLDLAGAISLSKKQK
eukprot:SAG31_NODE_5304_length_2621_cov_1.465504_2_plen_136_part_00